MVLDWGLNLGPPTLEASTLPLGFRDGFMVLKDFVSGEATLKQLQLYIYLYELFVNQQACGNKTQPSLSIKPVNQSLPKSIYWAACTRNEHIIKSSTQFMHSVSLKKEIHKTSEWIMLALEVWKVRTQRLVNCIDTIGCSSPSSLTRYLSTISFETI